jgi:hypothetical protein
MSSPAPDPERHVPLLDWRILFGLGITLAWLGFGLWYVLAYIGWSDFIGQGADALGSFLEGAFAPLAFLWLVIGYFLQQKSLNESNRNIQLQYEAMRKQVEHTEIQSSAIAANEVYARQEHFLKVSELVFNHLGSITGLLYQANLRGKAGPGAGAAPESPGEPDVSTLWTRVSSGDHGAFARRILDLCYGPAGRRPEGAKVFFGTRVRARHTQEFVRTFESLLDGARDCDSSDIIVNALMMGSAHGHLYRLIRKYEADGARLELAS